MTLAVAESASALSNGKSAPPRQDERDLPLFDFTTRIVREPEALSEIEPAWRRLVETAIEPNAFYEPACLLPATKHLAGDQRPEFLVIEAPKRVFPEGPKVLCGLFPLVRRRLFYGLPVRSWELWRHEHCFLGTPLVRRDCAREVIDCFFREAAAKCHIVHLPMIAGDGPLQRLLVESNYTAGRSVFTKDLQTRALFRIAADAETFLKANLSRSKRQGVQRIERRLAGSGTLNTRWFGDGDDAASWVEDFLRLESAGWKGQGKTALDSNAAHARFFAEMLQNPATDGRVMIGRLSFNGLPIAMICNLLTSDGGYSFKIAYDESFAEYSPGLLIELALIRELHRRGIQWMDSCAVPDHPLINPLWPNRTIRQSLVVSTGRRGSDLAVALMPLVRWFKYALRRSKSNQSS